MDKDAPEDTRGDAERTPDTMLTFYRRMQAQNTGVVLMGTLGLLFGTLLMLGEIWMLPTYAAAKHWPHAAATITSASKEEQSGNSDEYDLMVEYDYTIAGEDHTGQATLASGGSDEIDRLLAQTPPGTSLDIRYDPNDAGTAMLDRDARHPPYGYLWIAPAVVVLSVYGLVQVARATRRSLEAPDASTPLAV